MIDLAIVRAPHQVLYSAERLKDSRVRKVLVLDMFSSQNVNNTVTNVVKHTDWDRVIKLNYSARTISGKFKYMLYLLVLKVISISGLRINKLIIGEGGITFAKLVADNFENIERNILIGDGADILLNNRFGNRFRYYCRVGEKVRKAARLLKLKFEDEYQFDELFTYIWFDEPRLVINEFPLLKKSIESDKSVFDSNAVYFLGTTLSDRFSDEEIEYIYTEIFVRYQNQEIKFVPHRREVYSQLEILRALNAVTIIESKGDIIETLFVNNHITPSMLGSFFSNAVYSLSAIYPKLEIDLYHPVRRDGNHAVNTMDRRIEEIMYNELDNDRIRPVFIEV